MKAEIFLIIFFISISSLFAKENLNITSDKATVYKKLNKIIFEGDVISKYEEFTLKSDKMIVNYIEKDKKFTVKNISVFDNVYFTNETITATGKKGNFDVNKNLVVLQDNVIVQEKNNKLFSDYFEYNTLEKNFTISNKDNKKSNLTKNKNRVVLILEDIENQKLTCFDKLPYANQRELKNNLKTHSIVIYKDKKIKNYNNKNILFELVKNNNLKNVYIADKTISKTDAFLYIKGEVKCIYAPTISKSAISILDQYKIEYKVDEIINDISLVIRDKKILLLEEKLQNIDNVDKAYEIITNK